MKKRFLLAGLFAVSALMTACSDDDRNDVQAVPDNNPVISNPVTNPGTQALVLHGVANGDVTTQKTALADDGKAVVFTDGDKVSVFDGALINCEFASEVKDEGASADFTGTISESATEYYVLYPYQADASISDEKAISATLPAIQTATLNSFDPKANLSVAVCADAENFSLRNIGSLLKLTTTEEFDKIVVKSNKGEKIAGNVSITIDDDGIPTAQASAGAVSELSLVPAKADEKIVKGTYYVAMLPGVYTDGITIEFYKNGAKKSDTYKRFQKSLTFARSKGANCGELITANGVFIDMVAVGEGTFWMGANQGDTKAKSDESRHEVTLSSYSIGRFEVTQALWKAVMGDDNNPSQYKGDNKPVTNISWNLIVDEFLSNLNTLTGKKFRLPTEAQWEFAARGGNNSKGYLYSGTTESLGEYAWYYDNTGVETHEVGNRKANELGLYDMTGNVSEWCQDWYGQYSGQTNPTGPDSGNKRVVRGGGIGTRIDFCRVSCRNSEYYPTNTFKYLGFRLVL